MKGKSVNPDELLKAVEQVAAQSENNQERVEIESFIRHISEEMRSSMAMFLQTRTDMLPEPTRSKIQLWQQNNRQHIGIQIAQIVEIVLSKELL